MILKRPILIRWTSYMEQCLEFFEASEKALPSDKVLCHHVKFAHLCEEVGAQFSMDDPAANITIFDAKVGYSIKMFEGQLKEWVAQTPSSSSDCACLLHPFLRISKRLARCKPTTMFEPTN
jgi:hypothetical protein